MISQDQILKRNVGMKKAAIINEELLKVKGSTLCRPLTY